MLLKFEQLDVFTCSVQFAARCYRLAAKLPRGFGPIADQLRRAGVSELCNTAEAATEFAPDEKARIFRLALRSTGECVGLFALILELGLIPPKEIEEAKELAIRLIAMLTKLAKQ